MKRIWKALVAFIKPKSSPVISILPAERRDPPPRAVLQAEITRYCISLEQLTDRPVKIVSRGRLQLFLGLDIGDKMIATEAIDRLYVIFKKAGLAGKYLKFTADDHGCILIAAGLIFHYETLTSTGAFFRALAPFKKELSRIVAEAYKEAREVAALAPFAPGKDLPHQFELPTDFFITGADFKLPNAVRDAALNMAQKIRAALKNEGHDPLDVRELHIAAKLDGDASNLTDQELASYLIAKAAADIPVIDKAGHVGTAFSRTLNIDTVSGYDERDPLVIFEMARAILEKTYGISAGAASTEKFLDAVSRSSKVLKEQ
jgi:hypothetical protein